MKYIVIILSIILMSSCVSQKRCNIKYPPTAKKDSIYIEKIVKVPVYMEGDSILIEVPINCPDQELIISETGKLKQIISILNGKLRAQTNIKPDTIFIPIKETITVTNEVIVPQPERFVPKFYKWLLWIDIVVILLLGSYYYIRIRFK